MINEIKNLFSPPKPGMFYKQDNKGRYWTGKEWSYNKGKCKYFKDLKLLTNVDEEQKEGIIKQIPPDVTIAYEQIMNTAIDNDMQVQRCDIPSMTYWFRTSDVYIKVHWNKRNEGFSVMTRLRHPKQGGTELWRNYLTLNEVLRVLINPREHINKPHRKNNFNN